MQQENTNLGKRVIHAGIMFAYMFIVSFMGIILVSLFKISSDPVLKELIDAEAAKGNNEPFEKLISDSTIVGSIVGNLIFLVPYLIYDIAKRKTYFRKFSPTKIPFYVALGLVLNIIGTFLINLVTTAEDAPLVQTIIGPENAIIAIIGTGIITPLAEETIFRRCIINTFPYRWKNISIILSAVIFSMMHTGTVQCVYAFVFGLMFAIIYANSQNLWYSFIIHATINTSSTLYVAFPEILEPVIIPALIVGIMYIVLCLAFRKKSNFAFL